MTHPTPARPAWLDEAALRRHPAGTEVALAELLTWAKPAYGTRTGDWSEVLDVMLGWPSDMEVIETLAGEHARTGTFEEPVRIGYDDEEDCWYIGNGMHRTVAAVLAALDTITVTVDPVDETLEMVDIAYTIVGDLTDLTDDEFVNPTLSYTGTWLRSFRLGDTWVEQLGGGYTMGAYAATYYAPHDRIDELVDEITRRCARHGLTFEVTSALPSRLDDEPTSTAA